MTLFGDRRFAEVISQKSRDGSLLNLGWTLNPMTGILLRGHRETHRKESHVKTEAEIGATWPQARKHRNLEEDARKGSPVRPTAGAAPCRRLGSGLQCETIK